MVVRYCLNDSFNTYSNSIIFHILKKVYISTEILQNKLMNQQFFWIDCGFTLNLPLMYYHLPTISGSYECKNIVTNYETYFLHSSGIWFARPDVVEDNKRIRL